MDDTLNYYNQNANQFVQGILSVDFKQTQDRFLNKLPAGALILDFGCGSGRDTKYFLEKGYHVNATDGSEELCKLVSDYTGVIVKQISEGVKETTFDAIIDEMICNAWYSVREFHIHLSGMQVDGQVRDGLERAVLLPYTLGGESKLKKKVYFQNAWVEMIQEPGLIYKLAPMDEKMRKLNKVRKLWEGIRKLYESARRQGYEVWNRGLQV